MTDDEPLILPRKGILVLMKDGSVVYFPKGNDGREGLYQRWIKDKDCNAFELLTTLGGQLDYSRLYDKLSSEGLDCPECMDHIRADFFLNEYRRSNS